MVRRREGTLADVELLEPVTVALRGKLWRLFLQWAKENLDCEDLDERARCSPSSFATVLVAYGHELFEAGASLHYYRQLAAHVQKMAMVWEVESKW